MDVREEILEINHRVDYDLAGTVIGNVATAVGMNIRSVDRGQLLHFYEQVAFISALAQCKYMRMFAEDQIIVSELLRSRGAVTIGRLYTEYLMEMFCLVVPCLLVRYLSDVFYKDG